MNNEPHIQLDPCRHRKVRNYFLRVFLHVMWWDVLLNRPGLRMFRRSQLDRWQKLAVEFREIAVELGGVLIKLGQFLSVRVDVLPVGRKNSVRSATQPIDRHGATRSGSVWQ